MIIHDVAQGEPEWYALRAGRPTASEFSNLVTSQAKESKSLSEYAYTLAAEAFAKQPVDAFEGNGWTDRGKELEPDARETYALITDNEVREVGFVTDDQERWGCSPDGLIGSEGGVEFKCCKAKNHVKAITYYQKHKKPPPEYVPQCQGEMYVCELEWVDLCFYHPNLPPLIIRQTPDAKFVEVLERQLEAVLAERDRILSILKEV